MAYFLFRFNFFFFFPIAALWNYSKCNGIQQIKKMWPHHSFMKLFTGNLQYIWIKFEKKMDYRPSFCILHHIQMWWNIFLWEFYAQKRQVNGVSPLNCHWSAWYYSISKDHLNGSIAIPVLQVVHRCNILIWNLQDL